MTQSPMTGGVRCARIVADLGRCPTRAGGTVGKTPQGGGRGRRAVSVDPRATNPLLTIALSDVGGGSMKNGTPHSLARIPLWWMIRECFKAKTGIIFEVCMLKHEVGLDIDGDISLTFAAPKLPSPGDDPLRRPDGTEPKDFSLSHLPVGNQHSRLACRRHPIFVHVYISSAIRYISDSRLPYTQFFPSH